MLLEIPPRSQKFALLTIAIAIEEKKQHIQPKIKCTKGSISICINICQTCYKIANMWNVYNVAILKRCKNGRFITFRFGILCFNYYAS